MDQQHDHDHGHDHSHTHAPVEDPYYLDQLCLVGLSAAFGGICLALCTWQRPMLKLILNQEQFVPYIAGSGIVLVLFAVVRAVLLWIEVGKGAAHAHQATGSATESCASCSDHHHPSENHGHSHGDHEHSWAPWRYFLLLVPIVLFLMGLPNEMMVSAASIDASNLSQHPTEIGAAACVAMGPSWSQVVLLSLTEQLGKHESGEAEMIDFQTLEGVAYRDDFRNHFRGKRVWVKGQFAPDPSNSKLFYLVRRRIQCCYADSIMLNVPMLAKESIQHVNQNDWIKVTGTIDYFKDDKGYHTLLRVNSRKNVEKTERDPEWYLSSK